MDNKSSVFLLQLKESGIKWPIKRHLEHISRTSTLSGQSGNNLFIFDLIMYIFDPKSIDKEMQAAHIEDSFG